MDIKKIGFILVLLVFFSCSKDKVEETRNALSAYIAEKEVVRDNVIACAASNEDPSVVSVFLYPRENVSNISFYETASSEVDKNDFSKYIKGDSKLIDVFNGYLQKYEISPTNEKWVIVSFEEDGKIHLSNPIRLKQLSKPTEYLPENVSVDSTTENMPLFTWVDGKFNDSKIYFHVVSEASGDLLSGTYTFEKNFQYYKLDNVVLNVTREEPPTLSSGTTYNFTLLGVSEDNWVNLFSEIEFALN